MPTAAEGCALTVCTRAAGDACAGSWPSNTKPVTRLTHTRRQRTGMWTFMQGGVRAMQLLKPLLLSVLSASCCRACTYLVVRPLDDSLCAGPWRRWHRMWCLKGGKGAAAGVVVSVQGALQCLALRTSTVMLPLSDNAIALPCMLNLPALRVTPFSRHMDEHALLEQGAYQQQQKGCADCDLGCWCCLGGQGRHIQASNTRLTHQTTAKPVMQAYRQDGACACSC
jgi:hypothetical protein